MIDSARTFTFDRFVTPAGQAADLSPVAPAAAQGAGDAGSQASAPEPQRGDVPQGLAEDPGVSQSRPAQSDALQATPGVSDQAPEEAPAAGPVSGLASDAAPVTDDTDPGRPAEAGGNEADLDEDGDGSRIDTPVAEAKDASAPEAEAGALAPTAGSQPVQDQLPDALTASVAVDLSQTVQLPDGPNGLPDFQLNSDIALGVELAADLDSDFASPIEGVDLSDPLLEMPALEIVSPAHLATPAPVSTVEEDVAQLLEAVAIASPAEDFEPDIGVVAPLEAPELADVSHAADSISRPLDDLDVGGLGL